MSFEKNFDMFKEQFESFLDSLRQIEREMKERIKEVDNETFRLSEEIRKCNNLQYEYDDKNFLLQKSLSEAEASEERIKAIEAETNERLELSKKAQEKLDNEFKILDGQRLELAESNKQLQRDWEALEMEQRRVKLFEINLNKVAQDKAITDRLNEMVK